MRTYVFLISNFLSNLFKLNDEGLIALSFVFGLIIFMMAALIRFNNEAKKYRERVKFAIVYFPVFTAAFYVLNYTESFNALKISLVISIVFYIFSAFFYHVSNKNITKTLAAEYILVLVIVISLSYGLT